MKIRTKDEGRLARLAVTLLALVLLVSTDGFGQGGTISTSLRGNEPTIARGVLDGNLIETNFRNHGEMARWQDIPWGVWPRGIGGRHIDGVGVIVTGIVPGDRASFPEIYEGKPDTLLTPMILTYRDAGKRTGPNGELWGWLPLSGFNNPNRLDPVTNERSPTPALSDDQTSWPDSWPDRLDNPDDPGWAGSWNGFFGKGVFNADLEAYYVMDDLSDLEYAVDESTGRPNSEYGVYYPNAADSTMGGLGTQTRVRIFQWANVLAEDLMFILYRITNVGGWDHKDLYFAQLQDYGLGEEEGDENASFNPQEDVVFGWDQDGIGTRSSGGTYTLGYTGFAFLESPARAFDGLDNDEDGLTDESRFSGPGALVEGEGAIQAAAAGIDPVNFERVNGPVAERPAFKAGRWWTGDENMDWVGFDDENENGVWDDNELVNNDVGRDGLGPFDSGYTGPDDGEVDGIPTLGEPNFDELDVDESDQLGLTGFDLNTRPFYEAGDNLREDAWLFERIVNVSQFPLGTKPAAFEADIEPFTLFVSGEVELQPDGTDFFSTAWIFGNDENDFFKNRRTAQSIYNADYNFAQPPFEPELLAVPGDGRVTLSWDTLSVGSFDRFTQEFDFEGYKLYRGTDPLLSDARTITDLNGTATFFEPIAQFDLVNDIEGPVTVFGGEAVYNVGANSGLQFFYIDEDVTNGIPYYYALVAYDRGFRDPEDPTKDPIDPQENTFNVSVSQTGEVLRVSRNAAVAIPRSVPAGFVPSATNEDLSRVTGGIGSGSIAVNVLQEELVDYDATYRMNFFQSEPSATSDLYSTVAYEVINASSGQVILPRTPFADVTTPTDGFVIEVNNVEFVRLLPEKSGWAANLGSANELFNSDPRELDGFSTNWIANVRTDTTGSSFTSPHDYELRWVSENDSLYSPPRVFGFLRQDIPVFAFNASTNEPTEILIQDVNDSGAFDSGDELIISERPPGGGSRRYRYRIGFNAADPSSSVPPSSGDVLRITVERPFATGDFFQFTLRPSTIDTDLARSELDRIAVVPNPYIGTSEFEPRSQVEGRGERRVQFIHLPRTCTISIFNLRGELLKTIVHEGGISDGSEYWDLRTEGQQDIAFGVYAYHVDAPGIGEHVGTFALIK